MMEEFIHFCSLENYLQNNKSMLGEFVTHCYIAVRIFVCDCCDIFLFRP